VSFKELLDSWRQSAAAPRTARAYAVRLPLEDAAQLAALADMFPGRAPEQLISELLTVALKELAAAMPYVAGKSAQHRASWSLRARTAGGSRRPGSGRRGRRKGGVHAAEVLHALV